MLFRGISFFHFLLRDSSIEIPVYMMSWCNRGVASVFAVWFIDVEWEGKGCRKSRGLMCRYYCTYL